MNGMEGMSGDWAFTSAVRFRGHQAELVGARFKSDKMKCFLTLGNSLPEK